MFFKASFINTRKVSLLIFGVISLANTCSAARSIDSSTGTLVKRLLTSRDTSVSSSSRVRFTNASFTFTVEDSMAASGSLMTQSANAGRRGRILGEGERSLYIPSLTHKAVRVLPPYWLFQRTPSRFSLRHEDF